MEIDKTGTKTMVDKKQTPKEEPTTFDQNKQTTTLSLSVHCTIDWQKNAHHTAKTIQDMIKQNINQVRIEPKLSI